MINFGIITGICLIMFVIGDYKLNKLKSEVEEIQREKDRKLAFYLNK